MARQQRNNVDYFPHPVTHGKSMFYLRTKYGNDGYTVWFMILEKLGTADFHFLDLKDEIQLMYLSAELKVSDEDLTSIIKDLVRMGKFDADLWNDESIIYDQEFVDSIADAYKKRTNPVVNKESLLTRLIDIGRLKGPIGNRKPPNPHLKGSGNTQRIGEDSKEKNRKERARAFYKDEFLKAKECDDKKMIVGYYRFVGTIWNEGDYQNDIGGPADHILELESQISFDQYCNLIDQAKKRGMKIIDLLSVMINTPKYVKGRKSVYSTLSNWVKREEIQGTNHVYRKL